MKKLEVRLRERGYSIIIGPGALGRLGRELRSLGLAGKAMILTNKKIGRLYLPAVKKAVQQAGCEVCLFDALPDSEEAKSGKRLFEIYSAFVKNGLDRSSFVIALGGGIVGDVSGFAASTYMRGLPWVGLPTTLLAQVDSSIGGKTAINLPSGKNLVGTFHQPRLVLADTNFLKTLPDRELRNALAEVIKYAVIWDADFFSFLEKNMDAIRGKNLQLLENIVHICARIKKTVVEQDERETKGLRAILNYGHTFAHAFEAACEKWTSSIPHGEAVAVGMAAAGDLSCELAQFSAVEHIRQVRLIERAGLPVTLRQKLSVEKILECMQNDKKKQNGKLKFILPSSIGKVSVRGDVPLRLVKATVQGLLKE